ncbi:hypothetical protein FQZ97_858980 [compost metagenome]
MAAWPASRRAPRARSTTGAPCRWCVRTPSKNSSRGKNSPPSSRPKNSKPRACPAQPLRPRKCLPRRRPRPPCRAPSPPSVPRSTAPACRPGRPRTPTPTSFRRRRRPPRPWWATSTAPRPASTARHTTSCSTSAWCRSPCSKASRSASCRRAWMPSASATMRASTRWPARATASGPATTTSRSP